MGSWFLGIGGEDRKTVAEKGVGDFFGNTNGR